MGDEQEVAAQLLLGVPPDMDLLLRFQVIGVADLIAVLLRRQPLGLVEPQARDLGGVGQLRSQQGQLRAVFPAQHVHGVTQAARLHLHDVVKRADISHFEVQPGILVEVPGGGVLFRPEYGTHLEDPLEYPNHGLLVELGGLGQVGFLAKVVQPEDVGAALRPGMDDLRGVDFSEALAGEVVPERPRQPLLELEHGPRLGMAQDGGAQGQLGVQV